MHPHPLFVSGVLYTHQDFTRHSAEIATNIMNQFWNEVPIGRVGRVQDLDFVDHVALNDVWGFQPSHVVRETRWFLLFLNSSHNVSTCLNALRMTSACFGLCICSGFISSRMSLKYSAVRLELR